MADTRLDVLTIGNAIVDVIADATDEFLAAEGLTRVTHSDARLLNGADTDQAGCISQIEAAR